MPSKLQSNIKFFHRYLGRKAPLFLRNTTSRDSQDIIYSQSKQQEGRNMNPLKNILVFSVKIIIFLLLANFVLVNPLSNAISRALEGFDNNPLIKIISLDLIDNPLTFIRMSQYYISRNDPQKASLYLQYAEIIKSRYPYPKEVSAQILELQIQIKKMR
jgi:hypothetical protein